MGTLIHNGLLCTNNNDNHILLDGAVYFNDGIIVETGKSGDLLTKYSTHSKIDAEGKLIMPGWINAHMHCYSTYARGLVIQKLPGKFSEILENLWWKLDKALDSESIYFSTLIPAISAIKNGVTAFIDHHSSPNCIDIKRRGTNSIDHPPSLHCIEIGSSEVTDTLWDIGLWT